jgi:opacity protein-like surface antigen
MKTNILIATFVAVFALVGGAVQAQQYSGGGNFAPSYGSGYGGYGYHSSTLEEGFFRGLGAAAQGFGEANYLNSQAGINWQHARSAALDNHLKGIETYFAGRRANAEARAAERGPRLTSQEIVELSKKQAPARLTAYQYEPALGKVYWPVALTSPEFAQERALVDHAISERTSTNSGAGTDNHRMIQMNVQQMRETLKTRVASMDPAEYTAAKKFLASLEFEGRQVLEAKGLAVK